MACTSNFSSNKAKIVIKQIKNSKSKLMLKKVVKIGYVDNLSYCMHACSVAQSCLTLCDPMDCIAHKSSLSMEFSRQEYWSGLPYWSGLHLPNARIEPCAGYAPAGRFFTTVQPGKPISLYR